MRIARRVAPLVIVAVVTTLTAVPTRAQPELRSFTVAAAGDVLIHGAVARKAAEYAGGDGYDFTPMMLPIEPWIGEADLAICHLEGTLSPTDTDLAYYPLFNAPHQIADAIAAAGYDTCSTGGNHAMDRGWTGIVETLDVLDEAGVRHDGTARAPEERLPGLYDVAGVTVAHMSYSYGLNGIPKPAGKPWSANTIDTESILSDAAWARDRGAEFVILSMHWGTEYEPMPNAQQRTLAELLLASPDIDLILGSHAHVVQPIEWVGDEVVVYGMGNHLSNQNSSYGPAYFGTEDGVIVHLTIDEQPDGRFVTSRVQFTPTWVELPTYRILAADHALAAGVEPAWWLQSSRDRTVERITMLGAPDLEVTAAPWPPLVCGGRVATIAGTADNDLIVGTPDADVVVGRGGNDTVFGMAGDDFICGGDGRDAITGDVGHDLLDAGPGDDWIEGGTGSDTLIGGAGDDRLIGGPDRDFYFPGGGDDRFGWGGGTVPEP
jgi:poly-gamma-glutamate synthesis protein (capsule biosynthesis protein)